MKPRITQRELAERIGLRSAQSISNYERGLTEVPQRRLALIAEVTKKPLTFFLEEPTEAVARVQQGEDIRDLVDAVRELIAQLGRQGQPQESPATPPMPAEGP